MWTPHTRIPFASILLFLSIFSKLFLAAAVCNGEQSAEVKFNLELGDYFDYVAWKLVNNTGNIAASGGPYDAADFHYFDRRYYSICIFPCDYYNFTLQNSIGTGVDNFILAVNDKVLAYAGNFGYAISIDVFGCDEVPSSTPSIPSPQTTSNEPITMIPSSYPSLVPTVSPSLKPSLRPSFFPSALSEPTSVPSILPSLRPSKHPSVTPSTYPSLEPTTSSLPSTTPSSLKCTNDEVLVEFMIKTDEYAHEISWHLKDWQSGLIVYESKSDEVMQKNTENKYKICIKNCVTHELKVNDKFGDGIDCNVITGTCAGYYNLVDYETQGVVVAGNLITNLFCETHNVTLCKSDSPTVFPSSYPSSNPTQLPSVLPASVEPSGLPSSNPSSDRSKTPSTKPSGVPSSEKPSLTPSSEPSFDSSISTGNPSMVPSTTPSLTPSSEPSFDSSNIISSNIPSDEPSSTVPSGTPSLFEPFLNLDIYISENNYFFGIFNPLRLNTRDTIAGNFNAVIRVVDFSVPPQFLPSGGASCLSFTIAQDLSQSSTLRLMQLTSPLPQGAITWENIVRMIASTDVLGSATVDASSQSTDRISFDVSNAVVSNNKLTFALVMRQSAFLSLFSSISQDPNSVPPALVSEACFMDTR